MAKVKLKNIHRLIEAATNQLPVEQAFLADFTTAIEKLDLEEARTPSRHYKPSSMSCIRNMFFQKMGEETDGERSSSELIGICESGSDRHERLQRGVLNMNRLGMDCEYINVADYVREKGLDYLQIVKEPNPEEGEFETKLYHTILDLSFLCDGIIKYKGEYYILEIKTETIYKWQSRDGIAEEHIPQGTCYSLCFNIDKVLFLYENRDNCSKKAYMLDVTDDMKYEIISKIEECDGYVSRLTAPPKPLNLDKKTCTYCKYKKACRKAGK